MAEDTKIIKQIDALVDEEHALERAHGDGKALTKEERARQRELEVQLDQLWDLLRQRRARRSAGLDPDAAATRDPGDGGGLPAMSAWPDLVYDEWVETFDTLHMIVQILGKVRVALSPKEPEWAHITLYVSARGLSTGSIPMPSGDGVFDVEADFLAHEVMLRTSTGDDARVALAARPVAQFWTDFNAALASIGVDVELSPMPQEVPDPIPFPDDDVHAVYDPGAAARFWRALVAMEPVFAAYRADFAGKVSRVQFFWGSADLVVTRFSGVPCAAPPGTDMLTRIAHDVEQMNVGWWPGNAAYPHAAFYAYGYPKPDGIEDAVLDVANAGWNPELGEFILDYDVVCASASPEATVRAFFDASYQASATRLGWSSDLLCP